jgi:hypothetical protein
MDAEVHFVPVQREQPDAQAVQVLAGSAAAAHC